MEIAGPPDAPPPVPAAIRALAGDDRIRAVWRNALGGLTFELTPQLRVLGDAPVASRRFAKWAPDPSLFALFARLRGRE